MPTQRDILEAVSRGELSPEEAADQLASLAPGGDAPAPSAGGDENPSRPDSTGVRRVVVRASVCSVAVEGDPAIAGAEVSGRHQVRRDGDDLVVDIEPEPVDGHSSRTRHPRSPSYAS